MQNDTFILFGATGDLSREKIMPALFEMFLQDPNNALKIVAVSRRNYTDKEYRNFLKAEAKFKLPRRRLGNEGGDKVEEFLSGITYVSGDFGDSALYTQLKAHLQDENNAQNSVAYLAVSPSFYRTILEKGSEASLWGASINTRVLIEKPYAHSAEEFQLVKTAVDTHLGDHAYFVDHYLGKGPIREMFSFRKKNPEISARLSGAHISKVEVYIYEHNDLEKRGEYYDSLGAFIDIGANHLLQMLVHIVGPLQSEERAVFIDSLKYIDNEIYKYQYEGYRETLNVKDDSQTETAFKIHMKSALKQYEGITFVLSGGKAFKDFLSGARVYFKNGEKLVVSLKPEESIAYNEKDIQKFEEENAYKHVIEQSFRKDTSCFVSEAEAASEWRLIVKLKKIWDGVEPQMYPKNSNFI